MKLSEMSANAMCDALVTLAAPLGRLAADEQLMAALSDYGQKAKGGVPVYKLMGEAVQTLLPLVFGTHKKDVMAIVGALTGAAPAEIGRMNGLAVIALAREALDVELTRFFTSFARAGQSE